MTPETIHAAVNILTAPLMLLTAAIAALFLPLILKRDSNASGALMLGASLAILAMLAGSKRFMFYMFDGALLLGPFSTYLWVFLLATLAITVIFSLGSRKDKAGQGEYYFLLAMTVLGLMVLVAGQDLLTVFISVELLSVCLYALAAINRTPAGAEAGYKYFLMGSLGTAMLAMGLALVYGSMGSIAFREIGRTLAAGMPLHTLTAAGFVFLIAGFAFKTALAPFHMWVPDVYEGSPTPISAFMGTAVKAGGIVILFRIFSILDPVRFSNIFWFLAVITMVLGNLLALPQQNIKRLLAYSSISHAGYILTGFFGGPDGIKSALFYLVIYALANLGAFGVVLVLEKEERGITFKDLAGLGQKRPLLAASMAVFMLSLAGIPPLAGFFAKFYAFAAAFKSGAVWLVVIALVMSAVSVYYYLRILVAMYMEKDHSHDTLAPCSKVSVYLIALLALATIVLGIFSAPLIKLGLVAASYI